MPQLALPVFENPPAVETVMGVYFAPLTGWNVLRLGQLWAAFESAYPGSAIGPPVGHPNDQPVTVTDLNQIPMRALLTNPGGSELLQVQANAFLRNWRQTPENKAYTHYSQLKPKFHLDWHSFRGFLRDHGFTAPSVFQAEVTYVNHLMRGTDWDSYSDLAKLIKLFAPRLGPSEGAGRKYSYLPEAANVALSVAYPFAESGIMVQVAAHSAFRMPEGAEVLQLNVTATAAISPSTEPDLVNVLDRCHDAVILAFEDVTTDLAHERWGRQR